MTTRVTTGVENWIRDEKGMYIGANLWIGMDTPCVEPFGTGMIIREGFEDHSKPHLGGPTGRELITKGEHRINGTWTSYWAWPTEPDTPVGILAEFQEGSPGHWTNIRGGPSPYPIMQYPNPGSSSLVTRGFWQLSSAEPKAGNWHLRQIQPPVSTTSELFGLKPLQIGTTIPCFPAGHPDISYPGLAPVVPVKPGQTVKLRADMKVNDLHNPFSYEALMFCSFLDSQGFDIGQSNIGVVRRDGGADFASGSTLMSQVYSQYEGEWRLIPFGGFDEDTNTNWPEDTNDIAYCRLIVVVEWNPLSMHMPYPELIFDVDNIEVELS